MADPHTVADEDPEQHIGEPVPGPGDDGALPSDAIDLGHGTYLTKKIRDGEWVGIYEWHREPGFGYSAGYIPFTGRPQAGVYNGSQTWEVLSLDPLTLSPSLACGTCGHHGFIRSGRWEPC